MAEAMILYNLPVGNVHGESKHSISVGTRVSEQHSMPLWMRKEREGVVMIIFDELLCIVKLIYTFEYTAVFNKI